MNAILVFLHCPSNTGYAIAPLEKLFFRMAESLVGDWKHIHFAYTSLADGPPVTLPAEFKQVIEFDPTDAGQGPGIEHYLSENRIDTAFGFDQPVRRPIYRYLRRGGVRRFVTYWGAPMSPPSQGLKLWLKRLQVALSRSGPDHYIFESQGMANAAIFGRGVPASRTSVVHLGADTSRFRPDAAPPDYVYETFDIPRDRRIFFYAGHMEKRKGVDVLVRAAKLLRENHRRHDFQLLILGNREGQELAFLPLIVDSPAAKHVTFGGYRTDIPQILPGCYAGLIGSTGWDSFPRTAIEMTASGLPLLVSDLPGLNETVEQGRTGFVFPAGDFHGLASSMVMLLENPMLTRQLGNQARIRAITHFSLDHQFQELTRVMRTFLAQREPSTPLRLHREETSARASGASSLPDDFQSP